MSLYDLSILRFVALVLLSFCTFADAGIIGFSISFTGDEITITNTGSDPAYQVSEWTLDSASQWRKVQMQQGNSVYLAPGKTLKGQRLAPAAAIELGRADPLLLVLHDQAGSRIAQLAWRQAPASQESPVPTKRQGVQLVVNANAAIQNKIIASYVISVPYEGIERLTHAFAANTAPRSPLRHTWSTGEQLFVETGAAQGGAWLVHENAAGELSVQIVPDGMERGKEQIPPWLVWVRRYLLQVAAGLAGFGVLVVLLGLVRRFCSMNYRLSSK